jgi:hypothetical protein
LTALSIACALRRVEIVKLLLDAGADPNLQDKIGKTALTHAVGHIEITKLLNRKTEKKKREIEKTKVTELQCISCMENKRQIAFLDCTHVNTCSSCYSSLTVCPECRGPINNYISLFIN